jgi:hypothetical protein
LARLIPRLIARLIAPCDAPATGVRWPQEDQAMDELHDFRPLDPGRVNSMDPIEMRYWCRALHCSEDELQSAVAEVGEHVTEVRELLAARH